VTALLERPLETADLAACTTIFYAATDELFARWNQPPLPRHDRDRLMAFFADLAFGPGGHAWVAAGRNRTPVAFGIAIEREATWFLSFLFVQPATQASGVGRGLLRRLMPTPGSPAAAPGALHHTCVDSLQPISAGLYATLGILPRLPIFELLGRPRSAALPALPEGLLAVPFQVRPAAGGSGEEGPAAASAIPSDLLAELDAVDRRVLGWRRRVDHRAWLDEGRLLVRYRNRDGAPLGYGYGHPSGRSGPIAARDAALLPAILADVLGRLQPPDAWRVYVPGPSTALAPLIEAGFRIEGNPALWSSSADGPAWDGYLPASFALL